VLTAAAAFALIGRASAEQAPNEAHMLLEQCQAMLSGDAEIMARMTCENTIWSTLRAIERVRQDNPDMKPPYCLPGGREPSIGEAARLYVEYVNTHPETAHMAAEHALILALKASYPCPG
jgi:hypothetical protein